MFALYSREEYGSVIRECVYVVQAVKNVLLSTLTGLQRVQQTQKLIKERRRQEGEDKMMLREKKKTGQT